MQHPDEGTIHTWLDGELTPAGAAELETHIAECSECAAAVAEARGFIAGSSRIVSALDIVPGDVIPVEAPLALRRKQSWYNTAQFRAAAAVLFVAGASVILLRSGEEAKMASVMDSRAAETAAMESPAPQPVVAEQDVRALKVADQAKDEASAAKAQGAPGVGSEATAARESAEDDKRNFNGGQAQRVPVTTAPVAPAPSAPRSAATASERMRADRSQLSQVVVTGVAAAPAPAAASAQPPIAPLRVVRADTAGTTVRTTFEVSAGVEVILTETRAIDASSASTPQRQVAVPLSKTSARLPSPRSPSAPVADAVGVDSISWVSPVSGRSYVLIGPLSKEQLTVLRSRLPTSTR